MTVKRFHEVSFPLQKSQGDFYFSEVIAVYHTELTAKRDQVLYAMEVRGDTHQNSVSGGGLLDHKLMVIKT